MNKEAVVVSIHREQTLELTGAELPQITEPRLNATFQALPFFSFFFIELQETCVTALTPPPVTVDKLTP